METAILVFCGWLLSLCMHEFSHAIVAYWGGDTSVKDKGYLTFNVLRYADPFTTLVLPVIILALGGIALPGAAVYINNANLRSRFWMSAVSLAGPVGSMLSAALFAAPLIMLPPDAFGPDWIRPALAFLTGLIIFSVYFNLLPVPPFDGYGVIYPWLPAPMRKGLDAIAPWGIWIVLAIMMFVPGASTVLFAISLIVLALIGISPRLFLQGDKAFEAHTWTIGLIMIVAFAILSRMKKTGPDRGQPLPRK